MLREPTGPNGAQWGVTQDNYGKLWFQAGAQRHAGLFSVPGRSTATFTYPHQFEPDLNITWGAPVLHRRHAGRHGRRAHARRLAGSAQPAGAGNDVFRGDRLPKEMVGDYFYGEAVGPHRPPPAPGEDRGPDAAPNVYPLSEFIRSTDPLFRPVDMTTAPGRDDVHHRHVPRHHPGVAVVRPGHVPAAAHRAVRPRQGRAPRPHLARSPTRAWARDTTQPRMLNETPAQLVAHLSDPNGWWRDTAQQLLVLKQDKSVVPALQAGGGVRGPIWRAIHALWTLEGLGAADAALARATA